MVDEKTMNHIIWAAEAEMKAAIEKHGEFNSHHEAYAVLREEVQEMQECSERLLWSSIFVTYMAKKFIGLLPGSYRRLECM